MLWLFYLYNYRFISLSVPVTLFKIKVPKRLEAKVKWKSPWSDTDSVWIKVEFCASLSQPPMIQMLYILYLKLLKQAEVKASSQHGGMHCYICPEGSCFSYIFLLQCKIRPCLSWYWLFWNLFGFNNSWRAGSSCRIRPTIFFIFAS